MSVITLRGPADYRQKQLKLSVQQILKRSYLCSIATIDYRGGRSYIHTAYFVYSTDLILFFLSDPEATHSKNLRRNSSVAVAVYDTLQGWDAPKRGLQLFGTCRLTSHHEAAVAHRLYSNRFPSYRHWIGSLSAKERRDFQSRFYLVRVERLKIFDERAFGEETFVSVAVHR